MEIGEKIIPFKLIGVDGHEHSLSDYDEKSAIVLIFSCNHCPYVQAWEDRIVSVQSDYREAGVQVIVINSNDAEQYPEDGFVQMKDRAERKAFNFPYLCDETQQVARAYNAERTPEVFVFGRNRDLHYHGAIDDNYDSAESVTQTYLRDALDEILRDDLPSVDFTDPVGCTIKWKNN